MFELSQDLPGHLSWPSVMPALFSASQIGLFCYFEEAVFKDKAAHLGSFGQPGRSLIKSWQGIP